MNQVLEAQKILEDKYNVAADVWSVTSYTELRKDALHVERFNILNPTQKPKIPYVSEKLSNKGDAYIFASDNMKALPDGLAKWLPGPYVSLGTDGFGRSDSRQALRDFFEVDARHIAFASLGALSKQKKIPSTLVNQAAKDLKINPKKLNPMVS